MAPVQKSHDGGADADVGVDRRLRAAAAAPTDGTGGASSSGGGGGGGGAGGSDDDDDGVRLAASGDGQNDMTPTSSGQIGQILDAVRSAANQRLGLGHASRTLEPISDGVRMARSCPPQTHTGRNGAAGRPMSEVVNRLTRSAKTWTRHLVSFWFRSVLSDE